MLIAIPCNMIKKFNDYQILESPEVGKIIVTHGTQEGFLQSPKGNLVSEDIFKEKVGNATIIACHADKRNDNPLKAKGKIHVKYYHYIDTDENGVTGELTINYNEI